MSWKNPKTELAVAKAKIAKLEKGMKMFGSQKRAREDDDAENPRTNIKRPRKAPSAGPTVKREPSD